MSQVPRILCPQCGRVSYNINDVQQQYCGRCHQFHDQMPLGQSWMGSGMSENMLKIRFPEIPWREPIPITIMGTAVTGLGCRLCIALNGHKGEDTAKLPQTRAEFDRHLEECHGQKEAQNN